MPDSYEIANGFNPHHAGDASPDADNDGVSNLEEYLAGTDPRNSTSVFRITRLNRFGNDLVLSFLGGTGKTYSIERATNLPSVAWLTVTNVESGTNGSVTVTNFGGAPTPRGFYRLRLVP